MSALDEAAEAAYCKLIADGLRGYELDPRNFTQLMRARGKTSAGRRPIDYMPVDRPPVTVKAALS